MSKEMDSRPSAEASATHVVVLPDADMKAPEPFEDKNQECYWYLHGHLSDQQAVIAVALWVVENSLHDRDDAFGCLALASVDRVWYRDDPEDEQGERLMLCGPDDDGASPFTRVAGAS